VLSLRSCQSPRTLARGIAVTVAAAAVLAAAPSVPALAARASGGPAAAVLAQSGGPTVLAQSGGPTVLARSGGPADVQVRGADLVDAGTDLRLWGSKINVRRPMGSITKVMTALLVIRAGHLNQEIRVTRAAVRYVHKDGASSAGLVAGDVLTARQLLAAMLIPSGCDAAYLLATAYGPGRGAFVQQMNAMALKLGLTSTHFSGFDGMPYPTEYSTYSTPADLIRLGEQAMRYRVFRRIVARRSYRLAATPLHHRYAWQSTDKLLGSYRGAIGIKTGDTDAAGNCLLFEARRAGQTLIGVILHANPTDNFGALFASARRMLNWGFSRI